ncbi:RNA exonuclease 4 isoform X3 [Cricetulus griseus]|uniref:RNA exonuclease 4 isoform X3 n=1 Tax=Cricetulus griseus TaxID=10029 RepID=A0A9J7G823_CRIGR|nr:RNA exonuclease 4 isoform X3 [Cricetulus griseus]
MKAKATAPVSQPEPIKELVRKKARKRFRKSKAQGGSVAPGSLPAAVAVRPPKAPENFSQNWKALQEVRLATGRDLYLPQIPLDQNRRKVPRRGHLVTTLLIRRTSSINGKLRRHPVPHPQREEFEVVKKEVAEMLKGRTLVGHALHNDLKVLFLDHPKKKIRDTQKFKPFRSQVRSGKPSLKQLSEKILGIRVQQAEHCSVQDAQAAMRLYIMAKREWESIAADRRPPATTTPNRCSEYA